jgi:tRNA/tmRNA/rRNA uracil-C5-methylase (TrmA/RlmC/RlmD family)
MNILGRIVCSNPFSFVLGFGVGLVGLYVANRVEEQRKLENMQKEIEAAVRALEAGNLKLVETEAEKAKKN